MGSLSTLYLSLAAFILSCVLLPSFTVSEPIHTHSIVPNFTATYLKFIENSGAFLASSNGTFKAFITKESLYRGSYFSVIHTASNTTIWQGNEKIPISPSAKVLLTIHGLSITNDSNNVVWSTPLLNSLVTALQLLETGNLVLVDAQNVTLWESFEHPTDTVVMGQRLHVGKSLLTRRDHAKGDYSLAVTSEDLVLQWKGQTYWKLSMGTNAIKYASVPVSFMPMNGTGLYLLGNNGSEVVFHFLLELSDMSFAKLDSSGILYISNIFERIWFSNIDKCQYPEACGKMGLCTNQTCTCPTGFSHVDPEKDLECLQLKESTLSLPSACNESGDGTNGFNSSIVYLKLDKGMDYFANQFTEPVKLGASLSLCQSLCSQNCTCLAFFHGKSSGSCYLVENNLGFIIYSSSSQEDRIGYIKAVGPWSGHEKHSIPVLHLVMIMTMLLIVIVVMRLIWWRKKKCTRASVDVWNSSSSAELEISSIPGLPIRFNYEELVTATENFKTQIGSGGFSTVYKGTIPDNNAVAVKKITSLGVRGKKEFFTETATMESIYHINLVSLRGFCIQGSQCFLVYEYMNRGSLEKVLFGNGPVLDWEKRHGIALGMVRGLAYLHSGCNPKIVHCDIKPENILLHDDLQVKISDFGVSKFISYEKSKLLTTLRGTRGYLAPEWLSSYGISEKIDVYSYGMVLLELVRGRRNCLFQSSGTGNDDTGGNERCFNSISSEQRVVYFPQLALQMHKKMRYMELADPRLEGRVRSEEVEKLVRVALCCVHVGPTLRPSMTNVVAMLEGRLPIAEPRIEALEFLQSYGGTVSEASSKLTKVGCAE